MKQSGIYRIDLGNGYFYIGSSIDLAKRKREHKNRLSSHRHINTKMQHVFNKYGVYEFKVLQECAINELAEKEQLVLNECFLHRKNVNIAAFVERPMLGRKHSQKTKSLLSKKMKKQRSNKPMSDSYRKNLSLANKGKKLSDERRLQISDSIKNSSFQMNRVKTLGHRPRTLEDRKIASDRMKLWWAANPEKRVALSEISKKKVHSSASKQKMSASQKRRREREKLGRENETIE
jgi:group I intron endonuclease